MNIIEAIQNRHSVRGYTDKKIQGTTKEQLKEFIAECNKDSGLNIQLILDEPTAFSGTIAKYGSFANANNYIALVGNKTDDFEELCGYYGEKVVLKAQQLGLNTCWVAISFSKRKTKDFIKISNDEALCMVISVGYGETQGSSHKVKSIEELGKTNDDTPVWFRNGMEMAQLAPTAINQQKFVFELVGEKVKATTKLGFNTKTDLGIAKLHFEIGSGKDNIEWI